MFEYYEQDQRNKWTFFFLKGSMLIFDHLCRKNIQIQIHNAKCFLRNSLHVKAILIILAAILTVLQTSQTLQVSLNARLTKYVLLKRFYIKSEMCTEDEGSKQRWKNTSNDNWVLCHFSSYFEVVFFLDSQSVVIHIQKYCYQFKFYSNEMANPF